MQVSTSKDKTIPEIAVQIIVCPFEFSAEPVYASSLL